MRQTLFGLLVATSMVFGPLALAHEPQQPEMETPRGMLEDATRQILKAFEMMLKALPQYEAPEILKNGDIIIRRKRPEPTPPAPGPDDRGTDKTKT